MNEEGLQHIRWGSSFLRFLSRKQPKNVKNAWPESGQKVARKWPDVARKRRF